MLVNYIKTKYKNLFLRQNPTAKTLIVNKISTIKFLKNLSFGVNFKQHKMYKINTHKTNGARKIRL